MYKNIFTLSLDSFLLDTCFNFCSFPLQLLTSLQYVYCCFGTRIFQYIVQDISGRQIFKFKDDMLMCSRSSPLTLDEINAVFVMSNNASTPYNVSLANYILRISED